MRTLALRLHPGHDLKHELRALCEREDIRAGWILTCVGSLARLRLRLAGATDHLVRDGHFEIVSLTGTLSRHGSHLHLAAADEQGVTVGGHLVDGCVVRTTAELVVGVADQLVFRREPDPATGFDELVVER